MGKRKLTRSSYTIKTDNQGRLEINRLNPKGFYNFIGYAQSQQDAEDIITLDLRKKH